MRTSLVRKILFGLVLMCSNSAFSATGIQGDYVRIDGPQDYCVDEALLKVDFKKQMIYWEGSATAPKVYRTTEVCNTDDSQLSRPRTCYYADFANLEVVETNTYQEFPFGIPGTKITDTLTFTFQPDYQLFKLVADGDGKYSWKYTCTYQRKN